VKPSRSFLTPIDWLSIATLGVIGHFIYQLCFMGGLSRTTVSNSSLILGTSPVAVAMLTSAVGHERVSGRHWVGAALSVGGIYLLVGHDASLSSQTLVGVGIARIGSSGWNAAPNRGSCDGAGSKRADQDVFHGA
jgi:drug/metabolite transporter (DMT)-like permease